MAEKTLKIRTPSFSYVCKEYLNVNIDKSVRNSPWLSRNLTQEQIQYAIADVKYLIPLRARMESEVKTQNW
ncbi:3'-5' exonuclease domain-containing protein [Ditylenchus destructor]|uniref:3'-5' exonuclease domain-containing protein n=1 Tax=Ditylenchus destructor TaxID=166010 RepID=A0AAD4MGD0_9BILA|nr:3'-5' exonuclease domain-containing protein [Ditylenchus destructor]